MIEAIEYKILSDGTCSYCGKPADMIKLANGEVTTSDLCTQCDNYNETDPLSPPDELDW